MNIKTILIPLYRLSIYRRSKKEGINGITALSGWYIAQCHHCHCLCDALQGPILAGCLSISEISPTNYLTKFKLYGAIIGIGAEFNRRW